MKSDEEKKKKKIYPQHHTYEAPNIKRKERRRDHNSLIEGWMVDGRVNHFGCDRL